MKNTAHDSRIVLLEDDHLTAEEIVSGIGKFVCPDILVSLFMSEQGIVNAFPRIEARPTELFILDVMVRANDWGGPPYHYEGRFRAGIRIARQLRAKPSLADVPIIIHTVLQLEDLRQDFGKPDEIFPDDQQFIYVAKSADSKALFDTVAELTVASQVFL